MLAEKEIDKITNIITCAGTSIGCETVFRDFCAISSLALANGCTFQGTPLWEKREKMYLELIGKYEDKSIFPQMLAHLATAIEIDPYQDYMGKLYMDLFTGNKKLGQCFTPIATAQICAEMTLPHTLDGQSLPVTIGDECCGGGAMFIGAIKVLSDRGINWQRDVRFFGADIDRLCVHMTYIQLSLLGARAIITHQNTITQEKWDEFVSPMEVFWPLTLSPSNESSESSESSESTIADDTTCVITESKKESHPSGYQLRLF